MLMDANRATSTKGDGRREEKEARLATKNTDRR